jgi:heme/copper-type cytochrome/quinol oxidase subunit 3
MTQQPVLDISALPRFKFGIHAPIWWGQLLMAVIEGWMMLMLLAAFLYVRLSFTAWPPPGVKEPDLGLPTLNLLLLIVSCVPMKISDKAALACEWPKAIFWTVIWLIFGAVICGLRFWEWSRFGFAWDDHLYGSLVWLTFALHAAHLVAAELETVVLLGLTLLGYRGGRVRQGYNVDELYWYLVVVMGLAIYLVIYAMPHLT